ncbi:hypothetical protein [Lacihabitans lacunae]|uniref:DUF998 domain-containing protein n=1 Tax=Lacihabitans lacunae TaxID=1028214 RepID=A0ABV7Z2S6_9BACT
MNNDNQLISFLWIRRGIGFMGIALPMILFIGTYIGTDCKYVLPSISDYYHTNMHDFFVGILCVIAIFLFTYRGYDAKDNLAANLGSLFALGVAFFPTSRLQNACTQACNYEFSTLHLISATAFFVILAYFALVLFPKTDPRKTPSPQKLKRNKIFRTCGIIIVVCIVLLFAYFIVNRKGNLNLNIPVIFILESIALWAFGISWIIKGELILEDK